MKDNFLKAIIHSQVFEGLTIAKAYELAATKSRSKNLPTRKEVYALLKEFDAASYKQSLLDGINQYKTEILKAA